MSVKCFWLEETGKVQRFLRRYHNNCTATWRWMNGMKELDFVEVTPRTVLSLDLKPQDLVPHDDDRWPKVCDCGHEFTDDDPRQIFLERVYVRRDTGEEMILRNLPEGAMWDAWWYSNHMKGPDGRSLVVVCPGGKEWMIDSKASNCTMPDDWAHRCWIRHGEPPNITVDKNGFTCSAGGGSIQTSNYHGFLRNGEFTNA